MRTRAGLRARDGKPSSWAHGARAQSGVITNRAKHQFCPGLRGERGSGDRLRGAFPNRHVGDGSVEGHQALVRRVHGVAARGCQCLGRLRHAVAARGLEILPRRGGPPQTGLSRPPQWCCDSPGTPGPHGNDTTAARRRRSRVPGRLSAHNRRWRTASRPRPRQAALAARRTPRPPPPSAAWRPALSGRSRSET